MNSAFENCRTIDQIFHQEALDVEQKVKGLQVRLSILMIAIVDPVTLKDEERTVVKTVEGMEHDIKKLLRCGLRMESLMASDDTTAFLGQSMRI